MRKLLAILGISGLMVCGLAPNAFADHGRYDGDRGECDWSGDCGDDSYRHDYSNHDRNRNRNRERGAFSPDFDRSPVLVCMPNATCNWDRQPEDEEQR